MRSALAVSLIALTMLGCDRRPGGGTPIGDRTLRFTIRTPADCEAVSDYPYARNLFCPAAFAAAQTMAAALARGLATEPPEPAFFYYYQTRADPDGEADGQSQSTAACQESRAPWPGATVVGAGEPLCRLIAYATSPGPLPAASARRDNPVPEALRAYPAYFSRLFAPGERTTSLRFGSGSDFDPLVRDLGAAARAAFQRDYPAFASNQLYDPADWRRDPNYHGISGGGGGGWGGEIAIERPGTDAIVLVAFGGGGGAGMTSTRAAGGARSTVGGGGGGGMQIADGYRYQDEIFNGLGLGAGVGSDEAEVQYSYFNPTAVPQPPESLHTYDPVVVQRFQTELAHVVRQLASARAAGATVVLRGGGGMGAGAEYLSVSGAEVAPHALSTQAGFQFRYEVGPGAADAANGQADTDEDEGDNAYARLGDFYRQATVQAYEECGRDYANYPCICPATHAIVLCRMAEALGGAAQVPVWMRQSHCPAGSSAALGPRQADCRLAAEGRDMPAGGN